MSVVRTGYRQVLKQCHALSRLYPDPNDGCFVVFGILIHRHEFAAGGYGSSLTQIARRCFDRPSDPNDPKDSSAARIADCFYMIRHLHSAQLIGKRHLKHLERRKLTLTSANGSITTCVDTPTPTPASAESDRNPSSSAATANPSSEQQEVSLHNGTFLIQRTEQSHSQKFYRHTVITKTPEVFPPYSYLLPPEPVYPRNIQSVLRVPLLRDVMYCISASCREAKLNFERTAATHGLKVLPHPSSQAALGERRPEKLKDPLEESGLDLRSGIHAVPTVTITLTDFVEVEVLTRFVCTSEEPARCTSLDSADEQRSVAVEKNNVFLYYVMIRNLKGDQNTKGWHLQVLSQHLVVMTPGSDSVMEIARPGVGGNFPALRPGDTHVYEGGTRISADEGVLRGTLQVNAYREDGKIRAFDVHLSPTRLSIHDSVSVLPSPKTKTRKRSSNPQAP